MWAAYGPVNSGDNIGYAWAFSNETGWNVVDNAFFASEIPNKGQSTADMMGITPAMPRIIIVHMEGSGTPATAGGVLLFGCVAPKTD
jgi:hypothetical protein